MKNKCKNVQTSLFVMYFGIFLFFIYMGNTSVWCKEMTENKNNQCVEVHAKHILVDTESQANEILNKINDGKISFEAAAKESSKCPSKNEGGDLGYFKRGVMVKEFENTAFSTEKGKISVPVKTQFGWHLIKIIDKR